MAFETRQKAADVGQVVGRDKRVYLTSSSALTAYSMEVGDAIVHVTTNAANAITVTLPSVAAAVGLVYVIRLVTDGGVDCTIQDNNNDAGLTDIVLDTVLDYAVLISDGTYWYELASEKA